MDVFFGVDCLTDGHIGSGSVNDRVRSEDAPFDIAGDGQVQPRLHQGVFEDGNEVEAVQCGDARLRIDRVHGVQYRDRLIHMACKRY